LDWFIGQKAGRESGNKRDILRHNRDKGKYFRNRNYKKDITTLFFGFYSFKSSLVTQMKNNGVFESTKRSIKFKATASECKRRRKGTTKRSTEKDWTLSIQKIKKNIPLLFSFYEMQMELQGDCRDLVLTL
jgi:hypothetical protein